MTTTTVIRNALVLVMAVDFLFRQETSPLSKDHRLMIVHHLETSMKDLPLVITVVLPLYPADVIS
jgi:hypothetical protein